MGRAPCCDKANVKRGPWSPEEDAALKTYVHTYGTGGNWIALPRKAGLKRCGKSCRLRWLNYLRPGIKFGGFTEEEDSIIFTLYGQMGSRWSAIASKLPGRTDNDVKNYWNTKLKKKLMAGKVSLKTMTDNDTLPSTLLLTQPQKNSETQISHFPASQNQSSTSSAMPILDAETSSAFSMSQKGTSFEPIHQLCSPRVMDAVLEIGANYPRNNSVVSFSDLSHESSSISNSSSIIVDNPHRRVSLPQHAGEEAGDALMDFGFGFPYDIANGLYFREMDGEFSPSCYPELVD